MFPIGALIAVAVVAVRAFNNSNNKTATTPSSIEQNSRGSSTFWSDPGAGGTVFWQLILSGMAFGFTIAGANIGEPGMVFAGFVAMLMLFPAWIARVVLAPLGFVRLAYALSHFSRVTWRRDKPGGPALVAALGLAQQDTPWPSSIAWVETKLTQSKKSVQASGVVARGLLEAAKGNRESARSWLESVLSFDQRVAPTHVRAIAAEWLATDAAANGEWARVKELTSAPKWPGTRTLTLLGALAGRMRGDAMPTTVGLWFWWLMAPRRLWTFGFVRRAAALAPTRVHPEAALPPPPAALESTARATFLTLALKRHHAASASSVVEVANAWEAALSGELREKLFARATLIGGGEPDDAIAEVRELIEQALAPMLPAKLSGVTGPLPALIDTAVQARRDRLNNELEDKMSRMDSRKLDNRELPALEEWHEFMTLRSLYRQACDAAANQSDYALAHSIIRDKLVNFAVWLYNARTEKPMANAMFRLLETEAVVLGDAEAERLNKKNAACDL